MADKGWFINGKLSVNYIVYETNTSMFQAGGTTYAVNNCFSSFIYCFIGWIKYTLLLCIQDLRLLYTPLVQTFKSSLGLWFFEKLMSRVLKGFKTQFRETLEACESPNAPRTIKTTVIKSCYTVKETSECYFNLATHTHTKFYTMVTTLLLPFCSSLTTCFILFQQISLIISFVN